MLAWLSILGCTYNKTTNESKGISTKLCTPDPLPQAQRVYDYLQSIYGKNTLSSTMANVAWNLDEAKTVKDATGKYPAIACMDYIHLAYEPADWNNYNDISFIEDWWEQNGLVAACWHWNVPCKEGDNDIKKLTYTPGNGEKDQWGTQTTAFSPKNAIVEGTWENKVIKADLERLCNYMKPLQEKGIPIIWRPLHEAAGNTFEYDGGTAWFWWGRDGGEAYKALWRYMFDYFTSQGLNNLIWVWTSQTKDESFYPGYEYVDIIGRDLYNNTDRNKIATEYQYLKKAYPNKMIALAECGGVTDMKAQWDAGAQWLFFMPWYHYNAKTLSGHTHADEAWWQTTMQCDKVLTREDLPSFK